MMRGADLFFRSLGRIAVAAVFFALICLSTNSAGQRALAAENTPSDDTAPSTSAPKLNSAENVASLAPASLKRDADTARKVASLKGLVGPENEPAGPKAALTYRAMIQREARLVDLPAEIAEAVMGVESGYDPSVIGSSGEIGLMQILPSTARMMGFTGTLSELAVPAVNIHYGVTYLAQAWHLAGRDLCTAVMKYRAGHGETRFSQLSVDYCLNVRARLIGRGYAVTGTVPVATFGEAPRSFARGLSLGCRRRCLGGTRAAGVNLAALNNQLNSLVIQVRGTR